VKNENENLKFSGKKDENQEIKNLGKTRKNSKA